MAAIPPAFPDTGILSFLTANFNLLIRLLSCKSIDKYLLIYDNRSGSFIRWENHHARFSSSSFIFLLCIVAAYPPQSFHDTFRKGATMEKPKLLDIVRSRIGLKHMSRKTEEAYVYWIKRFVLYFDKRHSPREIN